MEVRNVLGKVLRARCVQSLSAAHSTFASATVHTTYLQTPSLLCRRSITSSAIRWQDEPKTKPSVADYLDSALDLKHDSVASSRQTESHFSSPHAQEERHSERDASVAERAPEPRMGGTSATDFLSSMRSASPLGGLARNSSLAGNRLGDKMNIDGILMPDISTALDARGTTNIPLQKLLPLPLPVRLGPNLGRTVKVNAARNVDVGKAFRQLEMLTRRNRVAQDFRKQLFHERPGLKKKRVRRERWRKTFKEGFKGMIAQVKKMKRQGW